MPNKPNPKSLLERAQRQHQQGKLKQALSNYRKFLKENPNQPDVLHWTGILLSQLGQHKEGLDTIKQAIKQESTNASFHNSMGNVLMKLHKFKDASKAYYAAIKLKPDYAIAYNNLGNAYDQQNRLENAVKAYCKAIELEPDFANAHFNYGRILLKQGELDTAAAQLQQAISLNPKHAPALSQLAHIYLNNNEEQKAIYYYQKRLAIQPNHAETHNDIGLALFKECRFEEARKHFEKTLSINSDHPNANYHLATTYLKLENPQQALMHYLRQLEKQPHLESYYNIGILLMNKEHHKDALSYFKQALELDPGNLKIHLNMAAIYLKIHRIQEAIEHYQKAATIKPNDPEIQHILAALQQSKTPEKAPAEYLQHLFDQYAEHYDTHLTKHLHYQVPKLLHEAIIIEANVENPQWKILELGCGTGLCGNLFKTMAKTLIGIDISEKMIEIAKEKDIYDKLEKSDVETALKHYNNIDLILAADVFTYIGELKELFRAAKQALNENGLFAFTVEKTSIEPYTLQQTIRYAHSKNYLVTLIKDNHFETVRFDNIVLRKQKGKPIEGYLIILRKK